MVGVGVVGHHPRVGVRGELQHEEVVVVTLGRPVEHTHRLEPPQRRLVGVSVRVRVRDRVRVRVRVSGQGQG